MSQPVLRHDPSFPARLTRFAFETFENTKDSVFVTSSEFRIVYFNPAYLAFARANGGGASGALTLGANMLEAIRGDARPFYERRLRAALAAGQPFEHEYLCSSAERYREYHQSAYPIQGLGLAFVNSLTVEGPLGEMGFHPNRPLDEVYLQDTGLLTQCSNCRRTLRADGSEVWDWVPSFVRRLPENASHSICPPCFDFYWKAAPQRATGV
jgi:hypothetical protein